MFNWEDMRHFLAVARSGTLTGAALALGVDHATVGRRITSLETSLNARLIARLSRRCALTPLGTEIFAIGQRMEAEGFAIERVARAKVEQLSGQVVLSAPAILVAKIFAGAALDFRKTHPGIQLSLAGEANIVSLSRQEADIAVRLVRPTEPNNVGRRIGIMEFALYASRDYVHLLAPDSWEFIGYNAEFDGVAQQQWLYKAASGRPVSFLVSDMISQHAATCAGAGVAVLPCFLAKASSDLVRLDAPIEPFTREIWIVVHRELRNAPPVRAVMDFIIALIEANSALNPQ